MKNLIQEKLDRMDELYPTERIQASKEKWNRLWAGEKINGSYPFNYGMMHFSYYDAVHTAEERVNLTLDEIIVHGNLHDDYIPSLFPGCKQSTIPTMFGAREIIKGTDHTCDKVVHSYDDIDRLPEPSLKPGTVAHEWLEMQQRMLELTEGRIPIHVTDMQGPVDVAGQLWGYDNLFVSAYEEPEYYKKIISMTTKAFIMFWQRQKELLGECFVPTHLFGWSHVPKNMGASISADSIVMVSPDYFDEFYRPCIEEIADAFGDVSLHSCGDFTKVFGNLTKIPRLKAVNAGQMTVEQLVQAGLNRDTVAIALSDITEAERMFHIIKENALRVEVSFLNIWPTLENRYLTQEEMTPKLWDEMKRNDEKMVELAKKCGD